MAPGCQDSERGTIKTPDSLASRRGDPLPYHRVAAGVCLRICWLLSAFVLSMTGNAVGQAYGDSLYSPHALAMRLRSKIPDLVTLPLENDLLFGVGPASATSNTLNFQPIFPFRFSRSWRIVTRTIFPLEYVEPAGVKGAAGKTGVGDINTSWFLSPSYGSN